MRYLVRLNKKAWNPVTGKVMENRVWEVEQAEWKGRNGGTDSGKVIWHCHNVVIRRDGLDTPIRFIVAENAANAKNLAVKKATDLEFEFFGIVVRGDDDSIVIDVRSGHDVN